MRSLLRSIFIDNWLRKLISFVLAIIIWFVVDQSSGGVDNVGPVAFRVTRTPHGQTK